MLFVDFFGLLDYNGVRLTKRRITMNDYSFGNFVCSLREKRGLTQADVARKLNVTPAAVSKWENGSSKPRVEVLFQLAEILGVRTEELMAGHYIEDEHLDADSIRMINEKYEHLRRIELHNEPKTKVFRMLAWIIDWNIIGFTAIILVSLVALILKTLEANEIAPFIVFVLILSFPVCFVLRDLIFGGRSLGKRILRLTILDKQTGKPPKKILLFTRNLFLFIVHIDVILMLITGLTIGDYASHTVVVRKSDLSTSASSDYTVSNEAINQYASKQISKHKANKKQTIILISVIALVAILFFVFVFILTQGSLNKAKETEEYKLAYSYVINSEWFNEAELDEDKLKFNSYSISSYSDENGIHKDAKITFKVSFWQDITVILHDNGNGWYVCLECTRFK